jgi:hypothetical protein
MCHCLPFLLALLFASPVFGRPAPVIEAFKPAPVTPAPVSHDTSLVKQRIVACFFAADSLRVDDSGRPWVHDLVHYCVQRGTDINGPQMRGLLASLVADIDTLEALPAKPTAAAATTLLGWAVPKGFIDNLETQGAWAAEGLFCYWGCSRFCPSWRKHSMARTT